jgi:hypothetical protein
LGSAPRALFGAPRAETLKRQKEPSVRKYIAQIEGEEDDIDFFVLNPHPQKREGELPLGKFSSAYVIREGAAHCAWAGCAVRHTRADAAKF